MSVTPNDSAEASPAGEKLSKPQSEAKRVFLTRVQFFIFKHGTTGCPGNTPSPPAARAARAGGGLGGENTRVRQQEAFTMSEGGSDNEHLRSKTSRLFRNRLYGQARHALSPGHSLDRAAQLRTPYQDSGGTTQAPRRSVECMRSGKTVTLGMRLNIAAQK